LVSNLPTIPARIEAVLYRGSGLLARGTGRRVALKAKAFLRRTALVAMTTLRRTAFVALTATLVSACGGDDRSGQPERRGGTLAAVLEPLDDPFFASMRDGLVATARHNALPISVEAAVDLQDAAGQASALQSLAGQGAACYILDPIDRTNLVQSLPAIATGTPIVNVESPVDRAAATAVGTRITAYVGTDDVAAGRLAADAMASLVPRDARIVVVTGIPGDAGSTARTKGFSEGARGRFEVVQTVAADFDRTQAHLAAAQLLAARPSIDGFFAVDDEMALGVAAAVQAAGRRGAVPVVGTDGTAQALAAIKRGAMSATVARYPFTIGRLAVEACRVAFRGKPVPANVKAPIALVTRNNVERALLNLPYPLERFDDPLLRLLSR
jgi:ABC-type sugar transport system substrate-binding protein